VLLRGRRTDGVGVYWPIGRLACSNYIKQVAGLVSEVTAAPSHRLLNSLAQRGPRDQAGSLGGGSRRDRGEGDLGALPQWECRGQDPR